LLMPDQYVVDLELRQHVVERDDRSPGIPEDQIDPFALQCLTQHPRADPRNACCRLLLSLSCALCFDGHALPLSGHFFACFAPAFASPIHETSLPDREARKIHWIVPFLASCSASRD